MIICIQGKVRRRSRIGRGIFRVERWNDYPFKVLIDSESVASSRTYEVGEHIVLRCEQQGSRIFVHAEVNRKPFVLGEIESSLPRTIAFSVLSVSGYEVTGKVIVTN